MHVDERLVWHQFLSCLAEVLSDLQLHLDQERS